MKTLKQYKLSELVDGLNVTIKGDPDCFISGVCPIQNSEAGKITFLTNSLYRKYLSDTQASAVILSEQDASECSTNAIITSNPYFVYSQIAAYFDHIFERAHGVHPSAVIGMHAEIHPTAIIGPYCVIGNHAKIGAHVKMGANTVVEDFSEIGEATQLDSNVTIYHHVKIGKRGRICSGVVIGSDGFGFANQRGVWHKVPQLGSVEIGDDVDIGANTAIDRGAVENTVIEDGVKLDNLIQIGHNVRIGAHTVMAGCTGVAGSTVIGKNCMIGGACMIPGHLSIADGVVITGGTGVSKSITQPGIYSSGVVGVMTNAEFRKSNARFHRLDSLIEKVKKLEATVKDLTERNQS